MADGTDLIQTADESSGRGRHKAPDSVWTAVRQDYLAGLSGPECCHRHGVGLTALRDRAAIEGWRRCDQAWTPPSTLDPCDEGVELEDDVGGNLDRIAMCELAYVAHRRMMRAVLRGDATEALRWRRVRLVMDAEQAEVERDLAQHEAFRIRRLQQAEDAAHLARAQAATASDAADSADAADGSDASDGILET